MCVLERRREFEAGRSAKAKGGGEQHVRPGGRGSHPWETEFTT